MTNKVGNHTELSKVLRYVDWEIKFHYQRMEQFAKGSVKSVVWESLNGYQRKKEDRRDQRRASYGSVDVKKLKKNRCIMERYEWHNGQASSEDKKARNEYIRRIRDRQNLLEGNIVEKAKRLFKAIL